MRDETMPESQEEGALSTSENMQAELQKKGAMLTKAWADLFSFVTQYQGELTVKENSMEIAKKEIDMRRRQFEEMKNVSSDSDEFAKLQDEIHVKERSLTKAQSELTVKEQLLRRSQSDLNSNMEMLEQSRHELLEKQNDIVRFRSDIEMLKSRLAMQQEQMAIKDNLLKKLQNQLMKENAELKEQGELDRRALEIERRAHEATRKALREKEKFRRSSSAHPDIVEIPDSPPTLDLSVEQGDFGLSNIISMSESSQQKQPVMEQDSYSSLHHSPASSHDDTLSRLSTSHSGAMGALQEYSSRLSGLAASTQAPESKWHLSQPSHTSSPSKFGPLSQTYVDHKNSNPSAGSDLFFPLSVSEMSEADDKSAIDTSTMNMITDVDMSGPVPISLSGPGSNDSNQEAVPISGPIPGTPGMSPGGNAESLGDGKWRFKESTSQAFQMVILEAEPAYSTPSEKRSPKQRRFPCEICGYCFFKPSDLRRHSYVHSGVRPFKCDICGQGFKRRYEMNRHKERKHLQFLPLQHGMVHMEPQPVPGHVTQHAPFVIQSEDAPSNATTRASAYQLPGDK